MSKIKKKYNNCLMMCRYNQKNKDYDFVKVDEN